MQRRLTDLRMTRASVAAFAAGLALITSVATADICVTCQSPNATYACAIDGRDVKSDDGAMRLYCITTIAKTKGHASCVVSRAAQGECAGERQVLASPYPAATPPIADEKPSLAPPNTPAEPSDDLAGKPMPKPVEGQPKTVSEMLGGNEQPTQAEKSAEPSNSMLDDAGQAVSDAAKKTWSCVSSFFGDC
jgi:hypothetical protein